MHAWAEVEHDLVYKPEKGDLSEDEVSILDEINGLVLSGEISLERLQRAIQRRASKDDEPFSDQFALASYLAQRAAKLEMSTSDVGKVDVLIEVLREIGQDSPGKLNRYVEQVTPEDRLSPIADVIVDKILSIQSKKTGQKLSRSISATLSRSRFGRPLGDETEKAMGYFLTQWIALEKELMRLVPQKGQSRFSLSQAMRDLKLHPNLVGLISRLRVLRNRLVHGLQTPNLADLEEKGTLIQQTIIPSVRKAAGRP